LNAEDFFYIQQQGKTLKKKSKAAETVEANRQPLGSRCTATQWNY
jgi:hypothetical protein